MGLPLTLIEPVARHHDEDASDDSDLIVSAVATADATVNRRQLDSAPLVPPPDQAGRHV